LLKKLNEEKITRYKDGQDGWPADPYPQMEQLYVIWYPVHPYILLFFHKLLAYLIAKKSFSVFHRIKKRKLKKKGIDN